MLYLEPMLSLPRYCVCFLTGVKKQLKALGRLKGCEELVPWRKAIISHLYWSACSTPSGDGDIMLAKFRSMLMKCRVITITI